MIRSSSLRALALLALASSCAHAEIIGVEQFDYPNGIIATKSGGTSWDYKNFTPTSHTGAASDWDNFSGAPVVTNGRLVTNGSSASREYNALEAEGAVNDPASAPSSVAKAVYYRVSFTTGPTVPDSVTVSSIDFGTEIARFGKDPADPLLGIFLFAPFDDNAVSGITLTPNTTYTLVTKLDYENDIASFYLNPDLNAAENSVPPITNLTFNATNWSTNIRLASGTGGSVAWDDLVVATTWEDLGTVVTTTADEDNLTLGSGEGVSLREAVKYSPPGSLITFAPGLSGGTITLTHTDGDMEIPGALTIDATALPGGLTVSGNNTHRHFYLDTGKSLTLRGLTLTGGNGTGAGANPNGYGGAISNEGGTLTLTQCTLSDNSASNLGGAIFNFSGTATLTQCTLSGNSASHSGAIENSGTLTLTQCTLSGNSATNSSGAIFNDGGSTLTLTNSIVAWNSLTGAGSGADIFNQGTVTRVGTNLVQSLVNSLGTVTGTGTISTADPKLSPLGYFGGPVQTMHPLIGSPAIDAIVTSDPGGTDARGFPRFVDGNTSSTGAQLDIGAVEAGPLRMVSFTSDPGASSSLRGRIASSVEPGARIGFLTDPNTPIILGSELTIPEGRSIFIDASNLSAPVTISGDNQFRVFNIPATATVAMHSVNIVNGNAALTASIGQNGGGILNAGALSLFSCTLTGNTTGSSGNGNAGSGGGGIFSSGSLTLTACTLSGNTAGRGSDSNGGNGGNGSNGGGGGGIFSSGPLTLTACTLSGNAAGSGGTASDQSGGDGGDGGGIFSSGSLKLTACTLSGNRAGNGGSAGFGEDTSAGSGGSGGGILAASGSAQLNHTTLSGNSSRIGGGLNGESGTPVTLRNCLIAGNTATSFASDVSSEILTFVGENLLGTEAFSTFGGTDPIIAANPLLAPLGDYGGPTPTMALRPGSPAREAATGSTRTTDQRGFPLVGVPDLGAYESGTLANNNSRIWETSDDFDGDGASNLNEFSAGTALDDASSNLRITATVRSGANLAVTFTTVTGRSYILTFSDTLTGTWTNTGLPAITGNGGLKTFSIPAPAAGIPKRFYRIELAP